MAIVTGDKQLEKRMAALSGKELRAASRKAIGKGLRIVAKAMKAEVPSPYKDAKKAIGSRFNKKGGPNRDQVQAKAGAGVGISKKAMRKRAEKQKAKRKEQGKKSGVGLGAPNIHWAILGTGLRKRTKAGGFLKGKALSNLSTGAMEPLFPDAIKTGFEKSSGEAASAIVQSLRQSIAIEARK